MATQSPFSLLNGLVERAVQAVQPPSWLVHETQQRIVLVSQPRVDAGTRGHGAPGAAKGRVARVQWRNFNMALVVTPAGLLNLAAEGAEPGPAAGDHRQQPAGPGPDGAARCELALRIQGDVQLAADINWLVDNVQWDVEEDMSRIIGDVPAHTLANPGAALPGRCASLSAVAWARALPRSGADRLSQ